MKVAFLTTDNREHYRQYAVDKPYFGTAPEALLQGFATLGDAVEVHVISCTQQIMRSPETLAPNIHFHSLHVPKTGWLRTGYQGCIRAVRRKLREIRPDIVHGQGTERDCAISAVLSGFPNVVTLHGNMRLIAKQFGARPFSFLWLAAKLESFLVPRTHGVVCITRYTQEAVAETARRTWVVPNAAGNEFFSVGRKPASPFRFLGVGHIQKRKNWNSLIRCLDKMASEHPMELVIFGGLSDETDYVAEFQQLIARRPWVRFEGMIRHEDIPDQLSQASALILPSLEDNCPMVVLEAMAAGVPVAAASVGGVPELLVDGKTGLLFDPACGEQMYACAMRLMKDCPLRESIATECRAEAMRRFLPQSVAQRHLEIYREVLGSAS